MSELARRLAVLELDLAAEMQAIEDAHDAAIPESFQVRCLRKAVSALRKATYHAELTLSAALEEGGL